MSIEAPQAAQLIAEKEQLVIDLQNARQASQTTQEHDPARIAAFGALMAVINYLKAIEIDLSLYASLLELAGALTDAENGLSNPLTRPVEFQRGGSTARTQQTIEMAEAAAAVTLLLKTARRAEAYRVVAEKAGVESDALRTFRKNISGKRAPKLAAAHYQSFLAQAARSGVPLDEQAERALEHLARRKRSKV